MKIKIIFIINLFCCICIIYNAHAYQPDKDNDNGGNPKLDKKTYKVYIQEAPNNSKYEVEVKEAIDKWKNELASKGITLSVQAGDPPKTPLDLNKYNQEVKKFNDDPNPDMTKYPEIQKYNDKNCTIMVYFKTTEEISKIGGGGSERGFASKYWNFDNNNKADKIEISDVFIPTDPPGGSDEVKKRIIHNISMHEFGHVSGFDHYTKAQEEAGEVMDRDATLHSKKL